MGYQQEIRQSLIVAWEASDRSCGKRLQSILPTLIPALERHDRLRLDSLGRKKLLGVSAATIDRLLLPLRKTQLPGAEFSPILHRHHPVAGLERWRGLGPGYLAVRLVFRTSKRAQKLSVQSLALTDSYSDWTTYAPVQNGEADELVAALDAAVRQLPFKPRGFVFRGLAFCQKALSRYCASRRIPVLLAAAASDPEVVHLRRSQPPAIGTTEALIELQAASSDYVNHFWGTRTVAAAGAVLTPCARLLSAGVTDADTAARLRAAAKALDPLQLLWTIRRLQTHLKILAAGFVQHLADPPAVHGPQHKQRHWRTHKNAFEAAWPKIQDWRAADPQQTGKQLLERLQQADPGVYREGQLRSLQRQLKQSQ